MPENDLPQIVGVAGVPDVALALRELGFTVITGKTFRDAAVAIAAQLKTERVPVVVESLPDAGFGPWVRATHTKSLGVVLVPTDPDIDLGGQLAEVPRLTLPSSIGDLVVELGFPPSDDPVALTPIEVAAPVYPFADDPGEVPVPQSHVDEAPAPAFADVVPAPSFDDVVPAPAPAFADEVPAPAPAFTDVVPAVAPFTDVAPAVETSADPVTADEAPATAVVVDHFEAMMSGLNTAPQTRREAREQADATLPDYPVSPPALPDYPEPEPTPAFVAAPEPTPAFVPAPETRPVPAFVPQSDVAPAPVPSEPAPQTSDNLFGSGTRRQANIMFSTAGKGGAGKTTMALFYAETAGQLGMNVLVIDANRDQGDVRTSLRLERSTLPTIIAAVNGDAANAIVSRDAINAARPSGTADIHFDVVFAPPRDMAGPAYANASVYSRVLDAARTRYDLIVVDTQIIEADKSDIHLGFTIPELRAGAWNCGIALYDFTATQNAFDVFDELTAMGVPSQRSLVIAMKWPERPGEAERLQRRFGQFSTFIGFVLADPNINARKSEGNLLIGSPAVEPVVRAVLYRVTGNSAFAPVEGKKRAKKGFRLFGGRK